MREATLNQYQKHVVDLMANVDENQQMEISNLLAHYFAQKAFDAADELWDSGIIGEKTIDISFMNCNILQKTVKKEL